MKQYQYNDIEAMQELVSEEFGAWSDEFEITQELINQFADLTGDHNWIHVDVERSKQEGPFGTTIAHGFMTLVMMPRMKGTPTFEITGYNAIVNYGSNKLRFTGPVPAGSRLHMRSRVKEVTESPKGTIVTQEQHIHIVGQDERPVLIYELIIIYM
ncbi:MAG: protein dehydratase [Halioglobus sp.]|nr:protein dehydratase [Halioglobus sp.]|tara:strand:+ start:2612 stop:3079 length:468 start_codon:yes stop_codon:yes gene_type:complete